MQVPLIVWETVAEIINTEFVDNGQYIDAPILVDIIIGVNADYHEEASGERL